MPTEIPESAVSPPKPTSQLESAATADVRGTGCEVLAAIPLVLIFVCCAGLLFVNASVSQRRREKLQQEIAVFCRGNPVEVTNTYAVVEGSKDANRRYVVYAVVRYGQELMTVPVDGKSVNIGDRRYLTVSTHGDFIYVALGDRYISAEVE